MANWCTHNLSFTGSDDAVQNVLNLFEQMAHKAITTNEGQLPEFIKPESGWMFDISVNDGSVYYQTKWSPNTDELLEIAEHLNVEFQVDFEELGNCIYGITTFKDGILTTHQLEYSDFELYEEDEETGRYTFEGDTYDCEEEILDCLLRRRMLTDPTL